MRNIFIISFFILIPLLTFAQSVEDIYMRSNIINRNGMLVLGGWAISNIAYGAYGNKMFTGEKKYFNQMNMMWNFVNAGIAGYALYQFGNTDLTALKYEQMVSKHTQTQNFYLFNAGLDILYMAGGAYMMHASKSSTSNHHRLKGYGQSVILQGGFLFAFDLAMYFIQKDHGKGFESAQHVIGFTPNGLGIVVNF